MGGVRYSTNRTSRISTVSTNVILKTRFIYIKQKEQRVRNKIQGQKVITPSQGKLFRINPLQIVKGRLCIQWSLAVFPFVSPA